MEARLVSPSVGDETGKEGEGAPVGGWSHSELDLGTGSADVLSIECVEAPGAVHLG